MRKSLPTLSLYLFVAILFGTFSAKAFTSPSSPYSTSQLNVPLNQSTNDSINGLLPYFVSQTPVEGSVASLTDADSTNTPTADIFVAPDGPVTADFAWDFGDPGAGYMWQLKRFDLWIPTADLTHSGAAVSFAVSSVTNLESFITIPNSSGSCSPAGTSSEYNYLRYDFPDVFVAGADPTQDKYPVTNFRYLKLSSLGMIGIGPSGPIFTQSRFVEVDAWVIKVIKPPQISMTRNPAGDVTLTWETISGRTYNIDYKNQLSDPDWSPLTTIIADADSKSVTDNGTSGLQRYYRIVLQYSFDRSAIDALLPGHSSHFIGEEEGPVAANLIKRRAAVRLFDISLIKWRCVASFRQSQSVKGMARNLKLRLCADFELPT